MKGLLAIFLIWILCFQSNFAMAETSQDFEKLMSEWTKNRELASQYLIKAEEELEMGDELSACATQREASQYGISATNSLIHAMEISGSTESLENLRAGLNKWKEIGEICGPFLNSST